MSFCEHCEGQRFDRARILRALRELRRDMREKDRGRMDAGIVAAIDAVRSLDIPHLETLDDLAGEIVH
jgi:hypothetical protein